MWTNRLLKVNARNVIARRGLPVMFAAQIIYALLSGLDFSYDIIEERVNFRVGQVVRYYAPLTGEYGGLNMVGVFFIGLFSALITLFVGIALRVGYSRFLMESRQGAAPISTLFSVFGNGYWNVVKARFTTGLLIVLWACLLVIPGIVKAYEYSQVSYLLAENPYMSGSRARELSRQMTEGEKWKIFGLGLSFLWLIIPAGIIGGVVTLIHEVTGVVVGGLLTMLVQVYIESTYAELYAMLRAKCDALGLAAEDELSGFYTYNS